MKMNRTRIMGSSYVGLFSIANDSLCFVPRGTEKKAAKQIEDTMDVKVEEASTCNSPLIAVFAKMNNKKAFLPSTAGEKEIEGIEKEIPVKVVETTSALGNLLAVNDHGAIISSALPEETAKDFEKEGLKTARIKIGGSEVVGSSILATSKGFVMSPNSSEEEVKKVQQTLNIKGGFSTANTGDTFIRNSVLANSKGAITGDLTTGHELNRIEEALEG